MSRERVILVVNGVRVWDSGWKNDMEVEAKWDRQVDEDSVRSWGGDTFRIVEDSSVEHTLMVRSPSIVTPGELPGLRNPFSEQASPYGYQEYFDRPSPPPLGPDWLQRLYRDGWADMPVSDIRADRIQRARKAEAELARIRAKEEEARKARNVKPPNDVRPIIIPGIHD